MPNTVTLNGERYQLVADDLLPRGRRALVRSQRPSLPIDARTISRRWQLSGPIGQSRERGDGFLGHDWSELETLYDDLLTSAPQQQNITLTGSDPLSTASAALGGFALGGAALGGGTSLSTPGTTSHIEEDRGYLFFHRGAFSTQINSSFSVIETATHGAAIRGASGAWLDNAYLGLGSSVAMQRRVTASSTGSTYEDVQISASDVFASEMRVGNDRLWMVDQDSGTEGEAKYSLDALASVSNSFPVGNRLIGATGIGTLGPYTVFGTQDGMFGFTDRGKPVRANDALRGHRSQNNGLKHASLWAWDYYTTDIGLYAWQPHVNNPVGLEAIKGFEGDIDGKPTAIFAWRESLFCAYKTTGGDSYILCGEFGPLTAATGVPEWHFVGKFSSEDCEAIFATSLATNPNILCGRESDAARFTMGRRGRDIADSNYTFSSDGGAWYGSSLTTVPGLHANLKYGSFFTENCDSNNTWQLAVDVDEADSYINVGSAVSSNGHQIVRPVSGSTPLATVDFHTLKPRLTQATNSTSTPPQIRGMLTLVYDARPDMIETAAFIVHLGEHKSAKTESDALNVLADHATGSPITIRLTDETSDRYGFVTSVEDRTDIKGDEVESVTVVVEMWETS